MTAEDAHIAALHAALLAADSATEVLERFFSAPVRVRVLACGGHAPDAAQRARLGVAGEEIRHRHVALVSLGRQVSDADLWYVPARLPPGSLARLETDAEPFGRVMRPLGLKRRSLSARICAPGEPCALEHRAVLVTPDGLPVAEVFERYPRGLFAPP